MNPLLVKKEEATKAKVPNGKTLADLAKEKDLPDWKAIALYNWGTEVPSEVNRLLFEYIGWEKADDDPGKTVLKPHANADREILIPKLWKQASSLAVDKTHTIKVKKQPDPPVAVTIDSLSRWFLPGKEKCTLTYSLEGLKKNAEKVQMEVYGSNYCAAGDWNNGFVQVSGADLKETKLYESEEQASANEREKGAAIKEWKGKVTTTDGALGKKYPGSTDDRVVNAAFSPYTAVLRYYKDDADKTARVDLDAFWPQFDEAGNPVADSLKIGFAVRNTARIASTQGGGTLKVYDKEFKLVYHEPISLANLGKKDSGFNEVTWDGNYSPQTTTSSSGGTKVIKADMPYRAQIQVHTGPDQEKGLALVAMSTEVRIYVHPQTHVLTLNPYVAKTDKPSFKLRSHRELLTVKDKIERGEGATFIRHELARAGYHPGPVEDAVATAYESGLKEFKRSIPKRKGAAPKYSRFTVDTTEGADVLDSIEDMSKDKLRHRPWWGDPGADRADFEFDADDANTRLNTPTGDIIVWVDDRHYYTDPGWLTTVMPKGAATHTKLTSDSVAMGNYALAYTSGDAMITGKETWIPRPWIPISVTPYILSESQQLTDELGAPSDDDLKIMAKAIGPLRVDWSFDEAEVDPYVESIQDQGMYSNQVSRPKLAVEHVRNEKKSPPYARKDVKKDAVYRNCPDTLGGVRPDTTADYYTKLFAIEAESLKPWRAEKDSNVDTVATVIHDHVGQGDDKFFAKRVGAAGIYFRPSTIGGDTARVRAQMRFKKVDGYDLENLKVLEKRYSLLPQAQSAAIRVWRKASLRGFVSWGPNSSWGTHNTPMRKHFDAAYLHFVFEKDDTAVSKAITEYFEGEGLFASTFSTETDFRKLVKEGLDTTGAASAADKERAKNGNISLNPQRLWPWYGAPQFGVTEASAPNSTKADAVKKFYKIFSDFFLVLSNLYSLEIVKKIEADTGKFRGHVVVEFQAGDDFYVQEYQCQTCNTKFWYVEKESKGDSRLKAACPAGGCAGKLKRTEPVKTGHYTCGNGHTGAWEEASPGGAYDTFGCVTKGCASALSAVRKPVVRYVCNKCGWADEFPDASGGDHAGEACFTGVCDGTLHRPNGDGGLYEQTYRCGKCSGTVVFNEATAVGGSRNGNSHKGCPNFFSGSLTSTGPGTRVADGYDLELTKAAKSGYTGIPVPSLGNPIGVSLNTEANAELWAHELAHNRYMEHAANAGGANNAQHDHEDNTVFDFVALNETVDTVKGWDRACLMTYAPHLETYDPVRDRRVLCGKCVLKIRGWKLSGVTDAAGGNHE